jgi:hypothetical protein
VAEMHRGNETTHAVEGSSGPIGRRSIITRNRTRLYPIQHLQLKSYGTG